MSVVSFALAVVFIIIANPGVEKCGRALLPRDQKQIILKLSELRAAAFAKFAEWKEYCDFGDIEYQKLTLVA